ncbi:hypothetical protein VZT92_023673 [Zoarces viviparus]|uniref:Ig-like domain-containing protein n=1 Tax=Zoarces viviparus TaxID=48416 RepID=A0AAW1E9D2_ZOAVI
MLIIFCVAFMFPIGRCIDHQSFVTKTVCVGEDVTLTCSLHSSSTGYLFWLRLVVGNFPEIFASTYTFDNDSVFKTRRITAKQGPGTFALHITKTELGDTAFYYCHQAVELQTSFFNKTFLRVKGPEPDITVVIQERTSDPVRPGGSVTLQCSVLSDSEKKTCPAEQRVFWFRAGSDESYPSVIYARGTSDGCEKSPEAHSPQKCVYSFSKNVSSSDAGTYYCAVATCGEILFGNGTKLDIEDSNMSFGDCHRANTILCLSCAALAISLIVIALLIYAIKKKKCNCCNAAALQTNAATTTADQQADEDSLVYSVTNFTRKKADRSLRRAEVEESIYSDVRVLG